LLNCRPTTEEKLYYFNKAKGLIKNLAEGKKLLEYSDNFITKKERIELFKSMNNLACTKEEVSMILCETCSWKERRIIRNYLNKKKD